MQQLRLGRRNHHREVSRGWYGIHTRHNFLFAVQPFDAFLERRQVISREADLIAMLDDATSQATARFVDHDSTEENLGMLGRYVKANGRPLAVYTDKASLFQRHPPSNPRRSGGR